MIATVPAPASQAVIPPRLSVLGMALLELGLDDEARVYIAHHVRAGSAGLAAGFPPACGLTRTSVAHPARETQ